MDKPSGWPPLPDNKDEALIFLKARRECIAGAYVHVAQRELQQREDALRKREHFGDLVDFKQRVRNVPACTTLTRQVRSTVIDLLRRQVAAERQDARNRLVNDSLRLGQVVYERCTSRVSAGSTHHSRRHGTSCIESWQDGNAFKQLAARKVRP